MTTHLTRFTFAMTVLLACTPLLAGEKTFTLQERPNQEWNQELMTWTVAFEPGTCVRESMVLFAPGK